MYKVLTKDELGRSKAYPEWSELGWFQNYRQIRSNVELHYHDLAEIYLWHEGQVDAEIGGRPVLMRAGMVAYTAAGDQHSYIAGGSYSNTGIMQKSFQGCRSGHLHVNETGENPKAKVPSFLVNPEENPFAMPKELPRYCFARHVTSGRFNDGQTVLKRITDSWLGLLVREGRLSVSVEDQMVDVPENHLFIASQGVELNVFSSGSSEVALAEGWPNEKECM